MEQSKLEQSSQAAWLKPVVVALVFGLVVAFFVTLFLVPAILVIVDKLTKSRRNSLAQLKLRLGYKSND